MDSGRRPLSCETTVFSNTDPEPVQMTLGELLPPVLKITRWILTVVRVCPDFFVNDQVLVLGMTSVFSSSAGKDRFVVRQCSPQSHCWNRVSRRLWNGNGLRRGSIC
jgi:hypothetical protein